MKHPLKPLLTRLVAVAAFLALLAPATMAQDGLEIGTRIPMADAKMKSVDGRMLSVSDVKGERGTVVFFWCNTCPWVKKYEQRMVEIAREYAKAGFGFIALNPNDPVANPADNYQAMQQRARSESYPFPYVVDEGSRLARAFKATRTPEIFVFDENNTLVYTGSVDDSPTDPAEVEQAYLRMALNQVAAGEKVEVQRTKSFGCTIKFQGEGTN